MLRYLWCGLIVALTAFAQGANADIRVEHGYVRAMPPGAPNTAAFMRLVNTGRKAVIIDGGSTDVAARVEFHVHREKNGMMSMKQVPSITVPAGGEFVLKPGHYHLMLINLNRQLKVGDRVKLRLTSGNKTVVDAELLVRSVLNGKY